MSFLRFGLRETRLAGKLVPLAVLGASLGTACSAPAERPGPSATEPVGEQQQAIITRWIPLRFVQLTTCNPVCFPSATWAGVQGSVERANAVFASTGIKFWIWSNELYSAPDLAISDTAYPVGAAPKITWGTVKTQIRKIFPNVDTTSWAESDLKTANEWLEAAAVFFGDKNVMQLFVHDGSSQSATAGPFDGRAIQYVGASFEEPPGDGSTGDIITTLVGHELGHYFGVLHPWDADKFDLVYCEVGGTPYFYANEAEFTIYQCPVGTIRRIETDAGVNCQASPAWSGPLTCTLPPNPLAVFDANDWEMRGVARPDTSIPPFQYALNVMLYFNPALVDRRSPAFFADSALSDIATYAAVSSDISPAKLATFKRDSNTNLPTGPIVSEYWKSHRNALGVTNSRTIDWANPWNVGSFSFTGTASALSSAYTNVVAGDFDGDQFADRIAFTAGYNSAYVEWGGPNRTFTSDYLLGFLTGAATFTKVFVGDFNGDGRDDVFVYGAGTLADYMKVGQANRTFTTVNHSVSGTDFVPFAGNFDGAFGDDIFWYRPSTGLINRWYSIGSTVSFNVLNNYPVGAGGPFTPIVGNFDQAYGDDIFWYVAGSSQDRVWYSQNSTNFTQVNATNVLGTYAAVAGDFDGDGYDDIYWHTTSREWDFIWPGRPQAQQFGASVKAQMYFNRTPVVGDFDRDYRDDVFWF